MNRTKDDAQKTREALLSAGGTVFARKGFDKATLDDIARQAHVTRGAVYWHFKDKTALFYAIVEATYSDLQKKLLRFYDEKMSPLANILVIAEALGNEYEQNADFCAMGKILLLNPPPCADNGVNMYKEVFADFLKTISILLLRAQEKKELPKTMDVAFAARNIMSVIIGIEALWLVHPKKFSIRMELPKMVSVTLRGNK